MDDLITERYFDSQAMSVIDVLGFFWHVIHEGSYSRAVADVRSTGVGIKCLYCTTHTDSPAEHGGPMITSGFQTKMESNDSSESLVLHSDFL